MSPASPVRTSLPDQSLAELFVEQAQRTPQQVALIEGDTRLSFAELRQQMESLAAHLSLQGVRPGQAVGLLLERSVQATLAILAVWQMGCCYVPLDPNYPAERLTYMVEDSQICWLLTSPSQQHWNSAFGCTASASWQPGQKPALLLLHRTATEAEAAPTQDRSVAYLMYTSGSTGRPKGVLGTHRGALNRFQWMWRTYPFEVGEVTCQNTSLCFVDSVWEVFGSLLTGVPAIVAPARVVLHSDLFVDLLNKHRVTRVVLVPSLLAWLLERYPDLSQRIPHLHFWISSGEALPADLVWSFRRALPKARLLNLYGSTEVAGDVLVYDTRELSPEARTVPLGRPIDNTTIYLLAADQNLIPGDTVGEICVAGDNLALGYHRYENDSFMQASSRIPERFYRTGDLGRMGPEGMVEFVGRVDRQIKVRGHRVEPGEVEWALQQHPAVKRAAVLLSRTGRLVAHLEVAPGEKLPAATLIAHLRQLLPDFMLPQDFEILGQLPRTPNGKLDTRALLCGSATPQPGQTELTNETLQRITHLFAEVLNEGAVGVDDDFFALGGHSLRAALLVDRLDREFHVNVPVAALFSASTPRALAQLMDDRAQQLAPCIATLQTGQAGKTPVVLVHGKGGSLVMYRQLVERLGPTVPCLGVHPGGPGGISFAPNETLHSVADRYVKDLRIRQPQGPYRLLGLSLGGRIAFAMSEILQREKETVWLGLIDSAAFDYKPAAPSLLESGKNLLNRLTHHAWAMSRLGRHDLKHYLSSRLTARYARPPKLPEGQVTDKILGLCLDYHPLPYHALITLFRARNTPVVYRHDRTMGWGEIAVGGIEIHDIPGFHGTILIEEPVLTVLMEKLRIALPDLG